MRKLGVLFGLAMLAGSSVAAAAPPKAATVELMQGLRDGTVKLADLVDPARGLVIADVFALDDSRPRPKPTLVCGADLDAALGAWQTKLVLSVNGTATNGKITCGKLLGGTGCTLGMTMEGDPAIHLVFSPAASGGVVLRAIAIDDEVAVLQPKIDQVHASLKATIGRLEGKGCPAAKR